MTGLLLVGLAVAGCSGSGATETSSVSGSRQGVKVDSTASYFADDSFLLVEVTVSNEGSEPVELLPSQCGRLAVTRLARTLFEPEGTDQPGSIGVAKELALRTQRFRQGPETMSPRDARLPLPEGGDCVRRDPPVALMPGERVDEVYSVWLDRSGTVGAVGSEHTVVQTNVIFASADRAGFSDIYSAYDAEEVFQEQRLRVEIPVSSLVHIEPSAEVGASDGQVFDRLMEHQPLQDWMRKRAEDSWRHVELNRYSGGTITQPAYGDQVRLRLVTSEFEDAAVALFDADLRPLDLALPVTPTRAYVRKPAVPPPAATTMPYPGEEEPWVLSAELEVGDLHLPTGRLVITEGSFLAADDAVMRNAFPPGTYRVTVTTARPPDDENGEFERVAFVTVHGDSTPVRWETALSYQVEPGDIGPDELFSVAVDGGTIGIGSAEVVEELLRRFDSDEAEYWSVTDAAYDRMIAYEYTAVSYPIDDLQFFLVSTGFGDGRYPIWVGFDEQGHVAQFVVEFGVVYLEFQE